MIVSTDTLAEHLTDRTWACFDCRHDLMDHARGFALYREGHIPGAYFAPVETALSGTKTGRNGRHPLPSPQAFADFLGQHGVTPETQIVAYDDAGGLYAARLWWLARWVGAKSVALLDGGFNRWGSEARPVSTESAPPRPPAAWTGSVRPGGVWTTGDVERRLGDPRSLVIDARAAERFRGETEPIDPVAGHVPGSVNRFYRLNLNPDLTLRPAEELRREFQQLLAGRAPEQVAHLCGSGITACANVFAMDYAGLPGSALYAGSWSEWIADPSRPVERG